MYDRFTKIISRMNINNMASKSSNDDIQKGTFPEIKFPYFEQQQTIIFTTHKKSTNIKMLFQAML